MPSEMPLGPVQADRPEVIAVSTADAEDSQSRPWGLSSRGVPCRHQLAEPLQQTVESLLSQAIAVSRADAEESQSPLAEFAAGGELASPGSTSSPPAQPDLVSQWVQPLLEPYPKPVV